MSTALVLGAGGMFAAWEVGAWRVLRERTRFEMIVGASAGAWVGWRIAIGATPEELEREWLDPRTAKVMERGLHRWGWLRPDTLHAKARELYAAGRPRVPFAVTLTEIPSLRVVIFRDDEITWQHLAATCSIPLSYPPVKIGERWYVDGGFRGALPLWAAEEMGANGAIGLNCLTLPYSRVLRRIMRARRPDPGFRATVIEPSQPLGSLKDAFVWSASNVERWIEQGSEDAKRALSSVRM
jgi:NTE family protein